MTDRQPTTTDLFNDLPYGNNINDNNDIIHDEKQLIEQYKQVEQWCYDQIQNNDDCMYDPILFETTLQKASTELQFPYQSLQSFFRTIHLKHIKSISYKIRNNFQYHYLNEYLQGTSSIKQIAKQSNYSPYLLSRQIVEHIAILPTKKGLINAMRYPIQYLGSIHNIKEEFHYTEQQQQQQQADNSTATSSNDTTTQK